MIVGMERYYYYPDALLNGVQTLTVDFIVIADRLGCISEAAEQLDKLNTDDIGRQSFRTKVLNVAKGTIKEISISKFK